MIIFQFTQKRSAKAERFIILLFLEGNYSTAFLEGGLKPLPTKSSNLH
ncbi:hypothetical protein BMETH_253_0 [methanotrophic bacterial endosymbiont of Bathymodiolus sp.]|nr:hypothetical protein BMETH_253_0 [methanotrophic bacterial endosymbiont of Bathymodiolus sp.]